MSDVPDLYYAPCATMGRAIFLTCNSSYGKRDLPIVLVMGEIRDIPTLYGREVHECPPFGSPQVFAPPSINERKYYSYLLNELLQRNQVETADPTSIALLCFLPLLQTQLRQVKLHCIECEDCLIACELRGDSLRLNEERHPLRQHTSMIEDSWSSFSRFIRCQRQSDWTLGQIYRDIGEEIRQTIVSARRIESQLRGYLQLEAGRASLAESKKSIEMSNRQIEEAKRGEYDLFRREDL